MSKFSDTFKVEVTGATEAGAQLADNLVAKVSAKATDSAPEVPEEISYAWYRADDASTEGTAIAGATSVAYQLTSEDEGKYVYVKVTYTGSEYIADAITSEKIGAVKAIETQIATTEFIGTKSAAETFDNYDGTGWTSTMSDFVASAGNNQFGLFDFTYIENPGVGQSVETATYPTFINGKALTTNLRGKSTQTSTYDMKQTISGGKIYLKASIGTMQTSTAWDNGVLAFTTSDGTNVFSITIPGGSGRMTIAGSTNDTTSTINTRLRGNAPIGFDLDLVIDLDANTATAKLTFVDAATSKVVEETKTVSINDVGIEKMTMSVQGRSSQNAHIILDNAQLYAESPKADSQYTVNYDLADGTNIKSETANAAAGDPVTYSKERFEEGGKRYFYVSDDGEGKLVSGNNDTVVTVTVREAEKYTVKAVASTDETKVYGAETTVTEGDTYTYSFPKYVTDESNKVLATSDGDTYTVTMTPTKSETIKIPYTPYEGTAYFVEAENALSSLSTKENANYSSGKTAYFAEKDSKLDLFTVVEDGTYSITYAAATDNNHYTGETISLYKGEEAAAIADIDTSSVTATNIKTDGTKKIDEISLVADDVIKVSTTGGKQDQTEGVRGVIDYILLEKTN